jgi:hypothetical protein
LPPLIGAEAAAASAATLLASAIVSAYLADRIGFTIAPPAILAVALAAAAATAVWLRRRAARDRSALLLFIAIVAVAFAGLLWLAWPELLPTGSGPDLVHHLALIGYIEQHWRLVHDVRLSEFLGEMVDYTPGFHLLAALVSAWIPGDALHVVYAVVSATVALKAGFVYLIARRLVPAGVPRNPFAVAAVLLLLAPRVYSIGSFTEQSYLAQVVSELFAVAMWWALVVWEQHAWSGALILFAIFGVATFLVWPVWVGPLLILLAAVVLRRTDVRLSDRITRVTLASLPIAIVAVLHAASHVGGLRMAGTGGFAITPTLQTVGWPFLVLAAAGIAAAARRRETRSVVVLVAAIALQSVALVAAAQSSRAANPYLAVKMFYLAIYPMAIAAAVLIAEVWRVAMQVAPQFKRPAPAWIATALVGAAAGAPVLAAPRPRPVVTEPVLRAAEFARTLTSPNCIDYLTQDGYTAYWLHLAVFGNARASGRAMNDDTFEPKKALVRWILPGGLPYAITDNFDALPRDIRDNVDVLAQFGSAAVVKRRGSAATPCP